MKEFDYIVLGGGSAGIASARRAAGHGARVALVEARRLGGTCVLLGCIPKKLMYNAAAIADVMGVARDYGFQVDARLDWSKLKAQRHAVVERLVGIYHHHLEQANVTLIPGRAKLRQGDGLDAPEVEVDGERLRAPHVLIATGGTPRVPAIAGAQLGITSNGFFELDSLPKRVAIVGAGYVGMEFAGILRSLGSEVTIFARHGRPLIHFDTMLQAELLGHVERSGIEFVSEAQPLRIVRTDASVLKVVSAAGEHQGFDTLIWAVGRQPNTAGMGLSELSVDLDEAGHVKVDEFQDTSVRGLHAVGDVTGKVPLTPVAIAAGRALSDRLFGGAVGRKLDYECIPTVIFSRPPVATVGLSEQAARTQFGDDVTIHTSRFTNLFHSVTKERPKTAMKLVTQTSTDRVLGVHIIGRDADEMIQGVAIAVRMGATKADFDRTVAVHPTGGEELVTMR